MQLPLVVGQQRLALLLLRLRGSQLRQIAVTGRLNGKPVSLSGRGNGESALPVTIESGDAGALLRYVDLYGRMLGGSLFGLISVTPRRAAGHVLARDFALRDEPAIRRLVAEAQTDGAGRASPDTEFTKMRIDFTRDGTEIAVKDAKTNKYTAAVVYQVSDEWSKL